MLAVLRGKSDNFAENNTNENHYSRRFMKHFLRIFAVALPLFLVQLAYSQNYQLVWEDNFDGNSLDSSKWNIEERVGVWNTGGNKEFQHYRKENVSVGNDGEGKNCLIITAKKEAYNGYKYTSGRVNTKGKVAFRRGKLEAMIKIPNLANGLWPAFWTLGYTSKGWPDCGEIDVLEMGHAKGISDGKQNSFIGSHLFWGPYPRDYGKEFTASQDLSKGYYKHTVVWDEKSISTYFNDSPTPYFSMGIDGDETEEFRNFQQYIILNMAVGGSVPGVLSESGITATFPARMYVDWVKVYQETGKTDLSTSDLPLFGQFGMFEDGAQVDMRMINRYDLSVVAKGLTTKTGFAAKAGSNVLAYDVTPNSDYELRLKAGLPRNFSNYAKGSIQFYINTDCASSLDLGVQDTKGNQAFVSVAATSLAANGKWKLVYVPLSDVAQKVDLSSLSDLLIIKGAASSTSNLAIDEVVVSETVPTEGFYGIYTNNSNITSKFAINNVSGFLYNWSNTVTFNKVYPAFDGKDVLCFRASGAANWWGFGIFSSSPMNFEKFASGYLVLQLRTESKETFKIAIDGANSTKGEVEFADGKDPYEFERDGKWHRVVIPMADFTKKGLDLSGCTNIFTMSGGTIANIAVDDVYLSETSSPIENPEECKAVTLVVSPQTATIKANVKKKFTVKATDQFGNPTDADVVWTSTGGTIAADGTFLSTADGTFMVKATVNDVSTEAKVVVEKATGITELNETVLVKYLPTTKILHLQGLEDVTQVEVYQITGSRVFIAKASTAEMQIDMANYPPSFYLVKVQTRKGVKVERFINR
jgi:beta-glucanase (GH16 family)